MFVQDRRKQAPILLIEDGRFCVADYTLTITVRGEEVGVKGIAQDIGKVGDAADKTGPRLSAFHEIASGAFRQLGAMATTAAVEVVGALGRAAVGSIGAAGDFEAGLNRMASVAGSSLAEAGFSLDDVKAKALDMGAKTQFSAAQAQDAMINLAKGGVPVVEIMGEATQATLDLAAAGEVDLANAADIVAKQLGVWASTGVTATNVADLLAQAANASTVGVEDLAMGLAQAGGVAKVTGVSFQDTVQTMALLAPGFASAADAGTSYKTFLSRMIPTSDAATKAMMDLGLATGKGNSAFFDAEGHFVGMRQAAELLHGATSGLSEAERMLALNTIFGSDAIRAAAAIAEAGGAGFDAMGVSMLAAGTAADQAAQRSQGFNFALDSLMGSAETLGIVAGSMLLPALTSLINNALIPGVNAVTEFFGALSQAGSPAATLAGTIGSLVMPAITGLTAALVAYAIVQTVQAIPAIYASIPALAASATAFWANAAAITAALAPYALIALAIGGVVMAYQNFTAKVTDSTTALLESRQWWNESSAALVAYGAASQATQTALTGQAETIRTLRTEIQGEVEDLGKRMAAGLVSSAQYTTEMAAINAKRESLIGATDAINAEIAAILQEQAASMTATTALSSMTAGHQQLIQAVVLTEAEMEKLAKAIEENYQKGAAAVQNYVATEISFLDQARQARLSGDAAALQSQAARYAQEQAAQSAHLGSMLIDYTLAQVQMGNIAADKAALITAAIEKQFGIQRDLSASTYLQMASHIDVAAQQGGAALDRLGGDLSQLASESIAAKQEMDALKGKYEATLVQNFMQGKIDADQLSAALRAIPEKVYTEVITKNITIYETRGDNVAGQGVAGYRAGGGPVWPGSAFMVGEAGKELFIPEVPGIIIPNNLVQSLEAGGGAGAGDIGNVLSQFKLTADVVDAGISTFQNIAQKQASGAQAVGGFANKTVAAMKGTAAMVAGAGVGAAVDFASGAEKIISLISSGVSAFNDLAGMADVPAGSFKRFADYLSFALYRFDQVVSQFSADAVVQASAFADHAGKIVGLISSGSSAFNDLATMGEVPAGSFKRFADYLTYAVYRLSEVAKSFSLEGMAYAAAFAESAGKVLGLLNTGVDGLIKLSTLTAPVPGVFLNFANQVKYLVLRMGEVASGISIQAVNSAAVFSEGAGKVLGIVGSGVEGLAKLAGFRAVSEQAMAFFVEGIKFLIDQFVLIASTFEKDAVVAAGLFAESVGKVLSIIGAGAEGFTKLADFKAVSETAIAYFVEAVKFTIDQFVLIASTFEAEGLAAAGMFAESVGKVVATIGAGVEGFTKLNDFQGVGMNAIGYFANAVANIVTQMAMLAAQFNVDAVAAAAIFSDGVGKVLAIIGSGVEGLSKLADFGPVSDVAIANFTTAINITMQRLGAAASQFSADAIAHAGKFATAAGSAVGILKAGVEGLLMVDTFAGASEAAIGRFADGVRLAVAAMVRLAGEFGPEATAAAATFAKAAGESTDFFKKGVDGFVKLEKVSVVPQASMDVFADGVVLLVNTIIRLSNIITTDVLAQAVRFATGMDQVIQVMQGALKAITDLGDQSTRIPLFLATFTASVAKLAADFANQVVPPATNIGANIAIGIANGITMYTPAIQNAIIAAINAALAAARTTLGIASESKVFHKMMEYAGEGMVGGLNAARGPVAVAAGGLAGVTLGAGIGGRGGGSTTNSSRSVTIAPGAIVINQQPGQDARALAKEVMREIEVQTGMIHA